MISLSFGDETRVAEQSDNSAWVHLCTQYVAFVHTRVRGVEARGAWLFLWFRGVLELAQMWVEKLFGLVVVWKEHS